MGWRESFDDCRLNEVPVRVRTVREDAAAAEELPLSALRELDRETELPHGVVVDERAEVHIPLDRVTDLDLLRLLDEACDELPPNPAVYDHARRRRALLPAEAERGSHHALDRRFEVCHGGDDRRILAAHLRDDRLRVLLRELAECGEPDGLRTREDETRHVGVLDELRADGRPRSRHVLKRASWNSRLPEDLVEPEGDERRVTRGLQDRCVAGDQRADGHPRCNREREVERRDDGPDAERFEDGLRALVRVVAAHVPLEAVVRDELLRVPPHEVRGLVDIRDRLVSVFPVLERHQRGEVELPRGHDVRAPEHDLRPLHGARRAPLREPGLRGRHGLSRVRACALLEQPEVKGSVRRGDVPEGPAFRPSRLAVDVVWVLLSKLRLYLPDGGVIGRVELLRPATFDRVLPRSLVPERHGPRPRGMVKRAREIGLSINRPSGRPPARASATLAASHRLWER